MSWLVFETAIGVCAVAWRGAEVTAFQLPEATPEQTAARIRARAREADPAAAEPPAWVAELVARVQRHLTGDLQDFSEVPVDMSRLGPFDAEVLWTLQRRVPVGTTITYGGLAALTSRPPGASQAIGRTMGSNPFPLLVPCHRVVAKNGSTGGGFSAHGGLATKEKLLQIEGTTLVTEDEKARAAREDRQITLF